MLAKVKTVCYLIDDPQKLVESRVARSKAVLKIGNEFKFVDYFFQSGED